MSYERFNYLSDGFGRGSSVLSRMLSAFSLTGATLGVFMDWVYLTFRNGFLFEDDGVKYCAVRFASEADAEAYLVAHDLRASIR